MESPTDLKPHYYFGVTVKDLHEADETPSFDDVSYGRITTPPPDVVPPSELNAATHAGTTHQIDHVSSTSTSAL